MNPTLRFYSKLLSLLNAKEFNRDDAHNLVLLYEQNAHTITLKGVTSSNLARWHKLNHDQKILADPVVQQMREIARCLFADLASQMRNEPVRRLHLMSKLFAMTPMSLYIRVQRTRRLGTGMGTITVVVDNTDTFLDFIRQPLLYVQKFGEVYVSEVDGK